MTYTHKTKRTYKFNKMKHDTKKKKTNTKNNQNIFANASRNLNNNCQISINFHDLIIIFFVSRASSTHKCTLVAFV